MRRFLFPVMILSIFFLFWGCDVNEGPDDYNSDNSSWERISEDKMEGLKDAYFVSSSKGFVVGNDGFMAKTEDAGDSWETIVTPTDNLGLITIHMKDNGTGFIGGRRGLIYYTTDEGANWLDMTDSANAEIDFVENVFITPDNGYLLATDGTLYRTLECGATWDNLGAITDIATIKDIHFVNMDIGYGVGSSGTTVKTTDGGSSWIELTTPAADTLSHLAVWFVNENVGFIAGQYRMHYRTIDAGENWLSMSFPDIANGDAVLELYFYDDETGFATTQDGAIYKTENAGVNWREIHSTIQGPINAIGFYDGSFGWLAGDDPIAGTGAFKITTDMGELWEYRSYGIGANLMGCAFYDENTGWAVGNGGYIYRTTDGGELWIHQESPVALHLEDIDFADEVHGIAAGQGQRIIRTTDGGENWTQVTGDWDDSWFVTVEFVSLDLAFIAGTDGVFLRSTDAGESWASVTLPMIATYNDLYFINATEGYAVGDNGTLIHTIDAGLTWELIETPTIKSFTAIDIVGTNSLWIAGANLMIHSPDGGQTWENFEVFLSNNYMMGVYNGISFIDDQTGWAIGRFGYRIHTVDGGDTWYRQNDPNIENDLKEIVMIDDDIAYVVGIEGMVLKLNP